MRARSRRPCLLGGHERSANDERLAREQADRAEYESRRRVLKAAGAFLLGRIADQPGRMLDLVLAHTDQGSNVFVKGQSTLSPGIITLVDVDQAHGLADALERGQGRVPTATGRFLQVHTIATGLQIRDPAMEGSWGLLVQLSKIEAGRMVDDLGAPQTDTVIWATRRSVRPCGHPVTRLGCHFPIRCKSAVAGSTQRGSRGDDPQADAWGTLPRMGERARFLALPLSHALDRPRNGR